MYKRLIFIPVIALAFITGCGKNDKDTAEQKQDKKVTQASGKEVTVEIHTSGMTCTGCEKTIRSKLKKVNGVKEVVADYQTNTVKTTFDDGKTNAEEIKQAITSAGYKVLN